MTELPRLKRCFGKSVTMRHLSSPRMPCAATTWATTSRPSGSHEPAPVRGACALDGASVGNVCAWLAPRLSEAPLDDVEVDAGALAGGGRFDEGAEPADDATLSPDDLADVLFVDLEL